MIISVGDLIVNKSGDIYYILSVITSFQDKKEYKGIYYHLIGDNNKKKRFYISFYHFLKFLDEGFLKHYPIKKNI